MPVTTVSGGSGGSIIDNCIGLGPFCFLANLSNPIAAFKALATMISNLIGVVTVVAGLWFMVQLIQGAFAWMNSAGDKAQLESARNRITHALIGLILVVMSVSIVGLVGRFLDIPILFDPNNIVRTLSPSGGSAVPTPT